MRPGLSNSSHPKRAGGALTLNLPLPGPRPAKDQWSIACRNETFRKGDLCSTTFFYNSLANDLGGEHHGRYLFFAFLHITLAFIPFLRS